MQQARRITRAMKSECGSEPSSRPRGEGRVDAQAAGAAPPITIVTGPNTDAALTAALAAELAPQRVALLPLQDARSLRAECAASAAVVLLAEPQDVAKRQTLPMPVVTEWLDSVYGAGVPVYPPRRTLEWFCRKSYVPTLMRLGAYVPHTAVWTCSDDVTAQSADACRAATPFGEMHVKPSWQSTARGHYSEADCASAAPAARHAALKRYAAKMFASGRTLIAQPHVWPFDEARLVATARDAYDRRRTQAHRRLVEAAWRAAEEDGVELDWCRVDVVRVDGADAINEIELIDACIARAACPAVAACMARGLRRAITAAQPRPLPLPLDGGVAHAAYTPSPSSARAAPSAKRQARADDRITVVVDDYKQR
jgi:hypothetical protein